MNLLICAPAVRIENVPQDPVLAEAGLVYITNPFYQKGLAEKIAPSATAVEDDDLCPANEELEHLIMVVKRWARGWHEEAGLKPLMILKGVHCSGLITQSLTVEFLKLLKPAHLYMKLLARYPVTKIKVLGDGPWKDAAFFMAHLRKIPIEAVLVRDVAGKTTSRRVGVDWTKTALVRMNRLLKSPRKGGLLCSSAPRYALPLLLRSGGCYLRDTFSAEMFLRSLGGGFAQALPEYFVDRGSAADRASEIERFLEEADHVFSEQPFFEWDSENLWPLVRECVRKLARTEMAHGIGLVSRFHEMLQFLSPRAVFVDEEVGSFNKALVQTANTLNIPTFAFVHGEPYDDIGSMPSSVSRILAWGPSTARRLAEWGADPAKIGQVGAPQFISLDAVRERSALGRRFGIPADAPLALFAAFAFETNERVTFLRTSYGMKLQEKSLAAALGALKRHPKLHLIVKFHPYEIHSGFTASLVDAVGADIHSRVRFIHKYDASKLIAASDVVLTVLSTMYPEALLNKKPVLAFTESSSLHLSSGAQWKVDIDDSAACAAAIDACLDPSRRREISSRIEEETVDYFIDGNKSVASHALRAVEDLSCQEVFHV